VDDLNCKNAAVVGLVVAGSVVVAFTILVERQVLKTGWLDAWGPMLVLGFLAAQLFIVIMTRCCDQEDMQILCLEALIYCFCVVFSFGGVVVSIVATIHNWQTSKFDNRNPSVIHNLPFLG
jgi:hypothetical protein